MFSGFLGFSIAGILISEVTDLKDQTVRKIKCQLVISVEHDTYNTSTTYIFNHLSVLILKILNKKKECPWKALG